MQFRILSIPSFRRCTIWFFIVSIAFLFTTSGVDAVQVNEFNPLSARPIGITAGPDGNLWFTENNTNKIGQITTAGVITTFTIPTASSGPWGITAGPDGNLWFTENNTSKIGQITTAGVITEFTIPTASSGPVGIAAGPDGNLWFTENNTNKIGQITTAGVITTFTIPTASSGPWGITAGPDGNLWFTENNTNKIGQITTAGVITEFAVPTALSGPLGITAGPDGNLWFTENNGNKIGSITTGGVITEFVIPSGGSSPWDITNGPDGKLWFAEEFWGKVGQITTAGVVIEFNVPTPFSEPVGIAAGPDGNIWFTEWNGGKIGQVFIQPLAASYTVTPSAGPNGTLTPGTPQTISYGSTTSFSVTPATGYHISSVTGCGGSLSGGVYTTGAITADCTVTASFAIDTHIVTPSAGANGSLAPGTPQTISYGSTTSFSVTPATGYHIFSVTGCGGSLSGGVYTTGVITADCTVTASFAIDTHIVTPSAGANGSLAPATPQTINYGSTASFSVTPDIGYYISSVTGCGGTMSGSTYTTGPVMSDCTVTATFAAGVDTTPDPFIFTAQTGIGLSTAATSNSITVSGINSAAAISITGGTYSINGGAFASAAGTVNNGDTVNVRLTSSNQYSATTSATLTIGGVNAIFNVTTVAANSAPIAVIAAGYPQQSGWTLTVKDASTDPDGNLGTSPSAITVSWGNGSYTRCAPGGSVSHTYTSAGGYVVSLTATDTQGLTSTNSCTYLAVISLGTVTGTVKTAGGAAVNLAKVTIVVGGATKTAYTNTTGTYTINNVKPGTGYPMSATKGAVTYVTQDWVTSGTNGTVNSGGNTVNFTP